LPLRIVTPQVQVGDAMCDRGPDVGTEHGRSPDM
jgi:hypothetical protein